MKNFKKIVCILGVILLVFIYLLALISAVINKPGSEGMFMAALYSTVVIPVIMYAILLMHKVLSNRKDNSMNSNDEVISEIKEVSDVEENE